MATYYWVGGAGTWNSTTSTKWSATSGGAGGAGIPTAADDVVFDANSGGAAFVVTVGSDVTFHNILLTSTCLASSFTGSTFNFISKGDITLQRAVTVGIAQWRVQNSGPTVSIDAGSAILNCTVLFQTSATIDFLSGLSLGSTYSLSLDGGGAYSQTINFNSNSFSAGAYIATSGFAGGSVVNLGGSQFTCTVVSGVQWNITNTSITINPGTSTITLTGYNALFVGGGKTYNIVIINAQDGTISGTNTFTQLSFSYTGWGSTNTYYFNNDQVIGDIYFTGGSSTARKFLVGLQFNGVTLTIASQSGVFTYWDVHNIKVAGSIGTLVGTALGNGSGNVNISGYAAARNVYWVGPSGNGYMSATSWASTATGAPSSAYIPRPQDTALFTSNYPADDGTIYLSLPPYCVLPKLDFSLKTNAFSRAIVNFGTNNGLAADFISTDKIRFSGTLHVNSTSPVNLRVDSYSGGFSYPTFSIGTRIPTTVNITSSTECRLDGALTFVSGTLNTNGKNIYCSSFVSTGTASRTLNLGASSISLSALSGAVWDVTSTGMTLNAGTSTILCAYGGTGAKQFNGGGLTYYNLRHGSGQPLTITGANTFNDITNGFAGNTTIKFPAGLVTTVTNFNARGNSGVLTLTSSTGSSQATLSKASGTVTLVACNVSWLNATGGATWYARVSQDGNVNGGNNTGWIFSSDISMAAASYIAMSKSAALSKTSRLATLSSAAVSASAAIARQIRLSTSPYANYGYVEVGYFPSNEVGAVSTASAYLPSTHLLATVSSASSSATATVAKTARLASNAASVAASTVTLTPVKTLVGGSSATSASTASLNVVATLASLASTASITNVLSAALAKTSPLAASAASVVAPNVALVLTIPVGTMLGTAAITNVISAALVDSYSLEAAAEVVSDASGFTYVEKPLDVLASSIVDSAVTLDTAYTLEGSGASEVSVDAPLGLTPTLVSSVTVETTTTASLDSYNKLTAVVSTVSTATATLDNLKPLAASAVSTATDTVTLVTFNELAANASCNVIVVLASFTGITNLAAPVTLQTTATAGLTVSKPLAASATAQASTNTTLYRDYKVYATAVATSTANVALTTHVNLGYAIYIDPGYVDTGYMQEGNIVVAAARLATTFASAAISSVTATVSLSVGKRVASTVTSVTTSSASVTKSAILAASVNAVTTTQSAPLAVSKRMDADAVSVVTSTSPLSLGTPLAAVAASTVSIVPDLIVGKDLLFIDGLGAVTNVLSADLRLNKFFAADVACFTVIQGGLTLDYTLASEVTTETVVADAPLDVGKPLAVDALVTPVGEGVMDVAKPLAAPALVLATVNGVLVFSHINALEDLGVASAVLEYQQYYVDVEVVTPLAETSLPTISADIVASEMSASVTADYIYVDAVLQEFDMVIETTTDDIFVYKKAA